MTYRFSEKWSSTTQSVIFGLALITYFESGKLITRDEAADILGRMLHTNFYYTIYFQIVFFFYS